ncbi:hypothetical protein [Nostoc sp.]|uniref:hypothetical protein n=1 Tax=Nostoc sp. TaxID=1180 RepID=UPI002FF59B5B
MARLSSAIEILVNVALWVVRLLGSWQDYQALNEQLGDRYTIETRSRYFPNINVSEVVTESLKIRPLA